MNADLEKTGLKVGEVIRLGLKIALDDSPEAAETRKRLQGYSPKAAELRKAANALDRFASAMEAGYVLAPPGKPVESV